MKSSDFIRGDNLLIVAVIVLMVLLLIHNLRRTHTQPNVDGDLGIADLVEQVKSQLQKADEQRRQRDVPALFDIKGFDLEINFVVKTRSKDQGSASFEVISLGTETEVGLEKVQKITLHMQPVQPERGAVQPQSTEALKDERASSRVYGQTPKPRDK